MASVRWRRARPSATTATRFPNQARSRASSAGARISARGCERSSDTRLVQPRATSDPYRDVLVMSRGLEQLAADPLSRFAIASKEQRQAIENLGRGEILYGGGNKSGKSHLLAAVGLSLAQGRRELAGIALPALPTPCNIV